VKKKKKKINKMQRRALLITGLIFLLIGGAVAVVIIWSAKSEDSPLAESIRSLIGIPDPEVTQVATQPMVQPVPVPTPPEVDTIPEPEAVVEAEPEPLPEVTMADFSKQRHLWPESLKLRYTKQVAIRYNDQHYGFMEFAKDTLVVVDSFAASGEVFCVIDGNFLSLSVHETNFVHWFETTFADQYRLHPIIFDEHTVGTRSRFRLGTPEGDAAFWAEMRIWCQQNYESVSLEIGEDHLVFRWLPKEDVPIDFQLEAREIARNYLLKRAKYGGRENYATCEIHHPITGEVLGVSAMFIPWL
jgi:hypothetical protein